MVPSILTARRTSSASGLELLPDLQLVHAVPELRTPFLLGRMSGPTHIPKISTAFRATDRELGLRQ
jgi:hypothetical protein